MSTRGFITFVVDDVEKTTYNHWDSYPEGLGADALTWLREAIVDHGCDELRDRVRKLRVVSSNSRATDDDVAQLKRFADKNVGSQDLHDWYVLLRRTQGDPGAMLDAGVIEDAGDFPCDSLFAEWGYVIDFDRETFEVYIGHQGVLHADGRFAERESSPRRSGYYPVRRVVEWPFSTLPTVDEMLNDSRVWS